MSTELVMNRVDQEPAWDQFSRELRKIVLGRTPGGSGEKDKALRLQALPDNLATLFPNLTHLYLWGIQGLKTLPPLPPKLECLDLRGCVDLVSLPALPGSLETLDLGDCAGLLRMPSTVPSGLRRFYFNGCVSLKAHSLLGFLESLRDAPIQEIDGSGTSAVTTLEEFPLKHLRKLVLKNSQELEDVTPITGAKALKHLNISGCTKLKELPDLPESLQFLVLHKAESLCSFLGQGIGPYDRGKEGQNVLKTFLTRKKFGRELAVMAHAKLLLMGDGRVGKTTLAKRLRWEELDEEEQALPTNQEFKPARNEKFTHRVSFLPWATTLRLPKAELETLEERVSEERLKPASGGDGLLQGTVRVWDFGGQEVYHGTHRIFAGEGSIFLLVWRQDEPKPGEVPEEVTFEEWREWNRQRPLDYWLDYIYSMRPEAKVALVCTNCPKPDQMALKPDWKARAPKHRHRDLPAFFVDSLDDDCGRHTEYQRLVNWVGEACGAEAQRIGILQPRFYRQVSDLLNRWLEENSRARRDDALAPHLLCPWAEWKTQLQQLHRNHGANPLTALEEDDISVITEYLHAAGHLFFVRHEAHRAILVDQEWAADLIYHLLLSTGDLRRTTKRNGGWFYRVDLETDPLWEKLRDPLQQQRLLAYMEECHVVTRITQPDRQREGKEVFLASDKWLLPEYEKVEAQVERVMTVIREEPGMAVREKFDFEKLTINEFDFRSLQALLARTFGTRAVYFRNGFQAQQNDTAPDWCFRLRWLPEEQDPFVGKIDALLVARRRQLDGFTTEIEDLIFAEDSPLASHRCRLVRQEIQPGDLGHEFFRAVHKEEYDVAVSSSGADALEAEAMVVALRASGLKVNWYRLPGCRTDQRERVLPFMNSLGRQPCIVLLLSEGYLKNDPAGNWYCAWELADAILQLGRDKRTADQTLVVFKESPNFAFGQFNELGRHLLEEMATFFHTAYGALAAVDTASFKYYDEFTQHFSAATHCDNWCKFVEARGAHGSAISYAGLPTGPGGQKDFSILIQKIAKAIGRTLKP